MSKVSLLYAGKRFESEELILLFLQDGETERRFTYRRGLHFCVGTTYQGETKKEKDGVRCTLKHEEAEKQLEVNEARLQQWRTASYAAEELERNFKFKKRMDKNPFSDELIFELQRYCKGMSLMEVDAAMKKLARDIFLRVKKEQV